MRKRGSYRPPTGFPARERDRAARWRGTLASILLHAAILALIISPTMHSGFEGRPALGAGGEGPAGGGGGGAEGGGAALGGRLRFVTMRLPPAPEPATAAPDVSLVAPPPPEPPATPDIPPVRTPPAPSAGAGVGAGAVGGTGEGSGPGSGGGIGSGTGTGTGSGVGPGTGGGSGGRHPPTPTQLFLPPLPAPERIKPYHLIAWFEVDERGNARLLGFNPSRDAGYNRRLHEVLLSLRFRPAVLQDGTPVRDTVDIHYIF